MNLFLNLIWYLFRGLFIALEYYVSSDCLMLTIIGIPFGLQSIKLGILALFPFGKRVVNRPNSAGCLNTLMSVIWIFVGGFPIFLSHVFFGLIFFITIIGIPFGKQHFKLAGLAFAPFGKEIIEE